MLICQLSYITEHSYLELGYLGGSSEIPKEYTPGFKPVGGARNQNLGHLCNVIQSNFDGSNIFGTIEKCSRHGWFEPLRVNYGAKSGSKWR